MIRYRQKQFLFKFVLVVLLFLGAEQAWSEETHQEPPTLAVSEEGTVQTEPDQAVISLSVETAGEVLEEVQDANRKRMKRVMDRLQKLGIIQERMQTSSLSITPHYPPRSRRQSNPSPMPEIPKIIGYTVMNTLTLEVWDLAIVGRVVDSALQAGANRFSHITWALRDERPSKLKALKLAARNAREKAQALAQALNVQLTQLLAVTEGGPSSLPRRMTRGRAMMSMATDNAGSTPVTPGELTIHASVTLVYEISQE
ncbi:SIMPL domain-containing protein [Candidatus Nitrospira salsa]